MEVGRWVLGLRSVRAVSCVVSRWENRLFPVRGIKKSGSLYQCLPNVEYCFAYLELNFIFGFVLDYSKQGNACHTMNTQNVFLTLILWKQQTTLWQQHCGNNNTVVTTLWKQHYGNNTVVTTRWKQHRGNKTVETTLWIDRKPLEIRDKFRFFSCWNAPVTVG